MIPTTTKRSSIAHFDLYAAMEIDFGKFLKPMTDDEFFDFCQRNRNFRIEMNSEGEILFMPPTGSETGGINFELIVKFGIWADQDGTGKGFDSSTGFVLPNGAIRSPDLSWMRLAKWNAIPKTKRKKFAPVCPDFVVEIRSESDPLPRLRAKMNEYIENGASLGWLIDAVEKRIEVYRPDAAVEMLKKPKQISGEPLLKGFVLDLKKIW
jgi:Uma2 family endonuclease